MDAIITTLYAGRPDPIGTRGKFSAINKSSVSPPWRIARTGLAQDEQADARNHGGVEKALHHYPFDHYSTWATELPGCANRFREAPAFGENISTRGITEVDVCVGDILQVGQVTLQVSQGRQPCWKLNEVFGTKDFARRVQSSGRTGWYYRVLETGRIRQGDVLRFIHRPQPDWPLSRLNELLFHRTDCYDELEFLSTVAELADGWRRLAARRVANRRVEDWSARLDGRMQDE